MKSMQEILRCDGKFSSRPEYFSGRGAIVCDLNYEILTRIKNEIDKEYGVEAGKEMVKMVAYMETCNATDFISNCYRLESNGFKWNVPKTRKSGIDIPKDENGVHNEAIAMVSIFGIMSGSNDRDETPQIRNRFLMQNGIQPKETMDERGFMWRY